jgi:hypothetical protein
VTWNAFLSPISSRQVSGLRGPARQAYDGFLKDLVQRGCAAMGYRLTGSAPINSMCVKHLRGQDRAIVIFREPDEAWILFVGPHNDRTPEKNIYEWVYRIVGRPVPAGPRTKPPCCDGNGQDPQLDPATVDDLVSRTRNLFA